MPDVLEFNSHISITPVVSDLCYFTLGNVQMISPSIKNFENLLASPCGTKSKATLHDVFINSCVLPNTQ